MSTYTVTDQETGAEVELDAYTSEKDPERWKWRAIAIVVVLVVIIQSPTLHRIVRRLTRSFGSREVTDAAGDVEAA